MPKPLLICCMVLMMHLGLQAQQVKDNAHDTLENRYVLNFMTPDMPAFKSLGIETSDMLRPSDIREFALMMNPFYSNGKVGIPKNFALEFAPWKIASQHWTLHQYHEDKGKRWLYHSSFSLGAISDSTEYASKLSIGYRVSILSKKADPLRLPYDVNNQFAPKADAARLVKTALLTYWITHIDPRPSPEEREKLINEPPEAFYNFLKSLDPKDPRNTEELNGLIRSVRSLYGADLDFRSFDDQTLDQLREKLITGLIEQ
jgi:hypothetical protein